MPVRVITASADDAAESAATIGNEWFGAIQTGFRGFQGFDIAVDEMDIGLVRWPGGTLSETRHDVYGLDVDGLFDATDLWATNPDRNRPDLQESLEYAVENDLHFSMILPTARFAEDPEIGAAQLEVFLGDLFTGKYGVLPDHFTLELGNEYYALDAFRDDPEAYGAIANRFAEVIADSKAAYLTEDQQDSVRIAVQMGQDADDNAAILGQLSTKALAATQSVVFHSLPINLNNLNKEQIEGATRYDLAEDNFDEWQAAIEAAGGTADPSLFLSAWTVGGSSPDTDTLDLAWHDFGARSAAVVLDTIAGYSSIGVDAAAVWGVDVINPNALSLYQNGQLSLTHFGEMFSMLSETLPGSTYLGEFVPHSRDDLVMSYTFAEGDVLANYVAINELSDENQIVELSIDDTQNFRVLSAEMLSTRLDPDFDGTIDDLEARLHEIPVRYEIDPVFSDNGVLIDFGQDYEVVEIVVELGEGTQGSDYADWINGDEQNDRIYGFDGDDHLNGGEGNDLILGGSGEDFIAGGDGRDRLYGDLGDDTLMGGDGDDLLNGGAGRDILYGGAGDDIFQMNADGEKAVIRDFELGHDHIDLTDVFRGVGSVRLTGPEGTPETMIAGTDGGPAYRLDIRQGGDDALVDVLDEEGVRLVTLRLNDMSADSLASSPDSFHFFEDTGGVSDVARPPTPTGMQNPDHAPGNAPMQQPEVEEDVAPEEAAESGVSWWKKIFGFGKSGSTVETVETSEPAASADDPTYIFETSVFENPDFDWGDASEIAYGELDDAREIAMADESSVFDGMSWFG